MQIEDQIINVPTYIWDLYTALSGAPYPGCDHVSTLNIKVICAQSYKKPRPET